MTHHFTEKQRKAAIGVAIGAVVVIASVVGVRSFALRHDRGDNAIMAALSSGTLVSQSVECPEAVKGVEEDSVCYNIPGGYWGRVSVRHDGVLAIDIYGADGEEVADAVKDVGTGKVRDSRIAGWHRDALLATAVAVKGTTDVKGTKK